MRAVAIHAVAIMFSAGAWGDDLYVPHEYPTIQSAIEAAVDGDMIHVSEGVYVPDGKEAVIDPLGKQITIAAMGDPAATIIDGQSAARGISCTSGETFQTIVRGFTITNGMGVVDGGGLRCVDSSPKIENCVFDNNFALLHGGGAALLGSSPFFEECVFVANAAVDGGGIWVDSGVPAAVDSDFINNSASGYGGAVFVKNESMLLVFDSKFTGGQASTGGHISSSDSILDISRTTFEGGHSDVAGSIYATGGTLLLQQDEIIGCHSNNGAGAIVLDNAEGLIFSTPISRCHAEGDGGAIVVVSGATLRMEGAAIAHNTAMGEGGGMIVEKGSAAQIERMVFCGNSPDDIVGDWTDEGQNEFHDDCPWTCLADIDDDGRVGVGDLLLMLSMWGECDSCVPDLDGDGHVGVSDLLILLDAWGPCPPPP